MASEKKQRLAYMDIAKGIAVLSVVIYHIVIPGSFKTNFAYLVIDPMLMLFFFASGYFYRPGKYSIRENIIRRFKGTMVPFFLYSAVLLVIGSVYYLITGKATLTDMLCCIRNFYGGCIWNRVIQGWFSWEYHSLGSYFMFLAAYWFLLQMFFASVLFYAVADRCLKSGKWMLGCSAGFLALTCIFVRFGVSLPYNLQQSPFLAFFILIGAYLGNQKFYENRDVKDPVIRGCIPASLAAGVVLVLFFGRSGSFFRAEFGDFGVMSVIIKAMTASLIFIPFIFVCRWYEVSGLRTKEIIYCGENSLYIYLLHVFFAWMLSQPIHYPIRYSSKDVLPDNALIICLVLMVASTALCIAFIEVRKRIMAKKQCENGIE